MFHSMPHVPWGERGQELRLGNAMRFGQKACIADSTLPTTTNLSPRWRARTNVANSLPQRSFQGTSLRVKKTRLWTKTRSHSRSSFENNDEGQKGFFTRTMVNTYYSTGAGVPTSCVVSSALFSFRHVGLDFGQIHLSNLSIFKVFVSSLVRRRD